MTMYKINENSKIYNYTGIYNKNVDVLSSVFVTKLKLLYK